MSGVESWLVVNGKVYRWKGPSKFSNSTQTVLPIHQCLFALAAGGVEVQPKSLRQDPPMDHKLRHLSQTFICGNSIVAAFKYAIFSFIMGEMHYIS